MVEQGAVHGEHACVPARARQARTAQARAISTTVPWPGLVAQLYLQQLAVVWDLCGSVQTGLPRGRARAPGG